MKSNGIKSKAIGVFDSGVGGLTVLKSLLNLLPYENFIYFGDLARLPYGTKSKEAIKRFSLQNTTFLIEKGVKAIVVACNTSTATALDYLNEIFSIPIIGVIEPAVINALEITKSYRIGVIGTAATIKSNRYFERIKYFADKKNIQDIKIYQKATPLFVPLIEEGWYKHPIIDEVIAEYLGELKGKIDTLILGCTHYPIIKSNIEAFFENKVKIVDSSINTAKFLKSLLMDKNISSIKRKNRDVKIYVSDVTDSFLLLKDYILGNNFNFKKVTLSEYI